MLIAIGLLSWLFLMLIGQVVFCGLIAAVVDYKCGGTYGERFLRAVAIMCSMFFKATPKSNAVDESLPLS